MGIYAEIRDFIKDVESEEIVRDFSKSSAKKNSIARKAAEGTLQFPVLVSRALDIDTMSIINKALERNFSSFAQIAFSMDNQFVTSKGNSHGAGVDYIKQFHSNHVFATPTNVGIAFLSESLEDVTEKLGDYFGKLPNIKNISELDSLNSKFTQMINSAKEPKDIFFLRKELNIAISSLNKLKSEKFTKAEERNKINEAIKWLKTEATELINQKEKAVKKLKESFGELYDNYITESLNENTLISYGNYEGASIKVIEENKNQLYNVLEDMRHDALNNIYKPSNNIIYNFKNKNTSSKHNNTIVKEADADSILHNAAMRAFKNEELKLKQSERRLKSAQFKQAKDEFEFKKKTHNDTRRQKGAEYKLNKDKLDLDKNKFGHQIRKDANDRFDKYNTVDMNKNMLQDNDVKKSNELVPTMLHVRINTLNDNGVNTGMMDFNVGIKAIMHPINSEEMISNIVSACRKQGFLFNAIRWTTGEIKFIKDLLLDIDNVKLDVYNRSKGASPWWLALKRRKGLSKINFLMKKNILPNATIVISEEEAELIKTEYGFDLHNPYFVDKIMDTYFLLSFVIVDNASQVAHFKFDNGYPSFETVAFSSLERENTNSERKFKDMLKVLSRN